MSSPLPHYAVDTPVYVLWHKDAQGNFIFLEGVVGHSPINPTGLYSVYIPANNTAMAVEGDLLHRRYAVSDRVRMLLEPTIQLSFAATISAVLRRHDGVPVYRLEIADMHFALELDLFEADQRLTPAPTP